MQVVELWLYQKKNCRWWRKQYVSVWWTWARTLMLMLMFDILQTKRFVPLTVPQLHNHELFFFSNVLVIYNLIILDIICVLCILPWFVCVKRHFRLLAMNCIYILVIYINLLILLFVMLAISLVCWCKTLVWLLDYEVKLYSFCYMFLWAKSLFPIFSFLSLPSKDFSLANRFPFNKPNSTWMV